MNVEEMIKLIDAGFTAEEIRSMNQPKPEPEPDAVSVSEPAPEPAEEPKDTLNQAMLKELQDLKKAVYAMNVMRSEQPEEKSVDDILMSAMKGGR